MLPKNRIHQKLSLNHINHRILAACLIALLLIITGIYSNKVKEEDYMYIDSGSTRVFTYKYGLALYEKGTHLFYNVSPYDMYYEGTPSLFNKYIGADTPKESVFSWSEHVLAVESEYNSLWKKYYRILSYFDLAHPTATFKRGGEEAKVTVRKLSPDTLTFTLSFSQLNKKSAIEMSFSLNDDDFLIDDKNNIYSSSDSNLGSFLSFNNINNYSIKRYEDIPMPLYANYLIIANPKMSGFYKIKFNQGKAYISTESKKVNFFVSNDLPRFDVELGDYLVKELAK